MSRRDKPLWTIIRRGNTAIITHRSGSAATHLTPAPTSINLDDYTPLLNELLDYRCATGPSQAEKKAHKAGYIKAYYENLKAEEAANIEHLHAI
jgi:hypothetical protein